MSFELPPSDQSQHLPPETPSGGRKRLREEGKTDEVVQERLPREEHRPTKKLKKEARKIEGSEDRPTGNVNKVAEKVVRRGKRKAEEDITARKKQKTEPSPRELLITTLYQEVASSDIEKLLKCLNTIYENNLHTTEEKLLADTMTAIFKHEGKFFDKDNMGKLAAICMKLYPETKQDETKELMVKSVIYSFNFTKSQDISETLKFLHTNLHSYPALFEKFPHEPDAKFFKQFSDEDLKKIVRFIRDNKLYLEAENTFGRGLFDGYSKNSMQAMSRIRGNNANEIVDSLMEILVDVAVKHGNRDPDNKDMRYYLCFYHVSTLLTGLMNNETVSKIIAGLLVSLEHFTSEIEALKFAAKMILEACDRDVNLTTRINDKGQLELLSVCLDAKSEEALKMIQHLKFNDWNRCAKFFIRKMEDPLLQNIDMDKYPRQFIDALIAQMTSEKFGSLNTSECIKLFDLLRAMPKEQRSVFASQLVLVRPEMIKVSNNPGLEFYLLPDSLKTKEKLIQYGSSDPKSEEGRAMDIEYREAIIASLEREFNNEKTAPEMLLQFAAYAHDNDRLHIPDEHPLIQHALEILTSREVEGNKNPFSLYKKLRNLAKEVVDIQPQEVEVAGGKTAFRLEQLQVAGKAFEIAREELSQDATEEAWNRLVSGLKGKVESNSAASRQLEEVYGTTWKELWLGSLSDSYLAGLLKLPGDKVSVVEAQFRAIFHYLLVKEASVKPGELFSEQEDLLIRQAMSIQHCSGGKKEGIALSYKLLDPAFKYRAKGIEGGNPEEIRAKEFLADVLQKVLSDQFSGTNGLMQELTEIQKIEQAPHQAIYLKNLIGPLVGLRHEVIFDKNSGVLYDKLIAKSREEVLQTFFRHFTPKTVVNELMRVVNNDFRNNYNTIRHIVSDLEGWDYDEETFNPIKLNERGALQLLQTAGYLT